MRKSEYLHHKHLHFLGKGTTHFHSPSHQPEISSVIYIIFQFFQVFEHILKSVWLSQCFEFFSLSLFLLLIICVRILNLGSSCTSVRLPIHFASFPFAVTVVSVCANNAHTMCFICLASRMVLGEQPTAKVEYYDSHVLEIFNLLSTP